MNYNIEKLHEVHLEILDFLVDVCNKNNLTYFLGYGTALGAYRHKDFIPWDDDMDIILPREDYEKFISIVRKMKDSIFEIQDENNEENYFLSFAKIRKKGTVFVESIAEDIYRNNGIYIDIFPLDNVGNSLSFQAKMNYQIISYWKHVLKFQACKELYKEKECRIKYIFDSVICLPGLILGNKQTLQILNNRMIHRKCQNSKFVVEYDDGAMIERDVFFPPRMMEFHGKEYCVPNKIELYLESQYGSDYMVLPPEEKRYTHTPIKIQF